MSFMSNCELKWPRRAAINFLSPVSPNYSRLMYIFFREQQHQQHVMYFPRRWMRQIRSSFVRKIGSVWKTRLRSRRRRAVPWITPSRGLTRPPSGQRRDSSISRINTLWVRPTDGSTIKTFIVTTLYRWKWLRRFATPSPLTSTSWSTSSSPCIRREFPPTTPFRKCSSGKGTPCIWCTRGESRRVVGKLVCERFTIYMLPPNFFIVIA